MYESHTYGPPATPTRDGIKANLLPAHADCLRDCAALGGPSLGGGGRKFMLKVKVRPRSIEIHRKPIPKDFRVSMSVPGCAIPILGLLFSKYLLSKTRDCEQNSCHVCEYESKL